MSTEELQMAEIKRLQLEAKNKLKQSRRSFQRLAKSSRPMKVVKGSKPPTETKEFSFSKATTGTPHAGGGAGGVEPLHPSNFASILRSRHPSDNLDPLVGTLVSSGWSVVRNCGVHYLETTAVLQHWWLL